MLAGELALLVGCTVGLIMIFNNSGVFQGTLGVGFGRTGGYLGPAPATVGPEYLLLRPATQGGDLVAPHAIGVHGLTLLAVPAVLLAAPVGRPGSGCGSPECCRRVVVAWPLLGTRCAGSRSVSCRRRRWSRSRSARSCWSGAGPGCAAPGADVRDPQYQSGRMSRVVRSRLSSSANCGSVRGSSYRKK